MSGCSSLQCSALSAFIESVSELLQAYLSLFFSATSSAATPAPICRCRFHSFLTSLVPTSPSAAATWVHRQAGRKSSSIWRRLSSRQAGREKGGRRWKQQNVKGCETHTWSCFHSFLYPTVDLRV